MALAVLSIDLVAKLASLEEGFHKAQQLAEKSSAAMSSAFSAAGGALKGVAAALGAAFSVHEIIEFVRSTNEGVVALKELSVATGSTVENVSALEDIAAKTGNSFDAVATSLIKFNKALIGAKKGDDATRVFDALGLSVKELKALDPAEALRRTAAALEEFSDDGDKARAVQVLFSRSVREAAPFIHELAKQTQLSGTVTTEAAKAAKEFDDSLNTLAKHSKDTGRGIVEPIVGWLNTLIEKFLEVRKHSREFFKGLREADEKEMAAASAPQTAQLMIDRIAALNKLLDSGNLTAERRIRLTNQLNALLRTQAGLTPDRNENFDGPAETRARPKPSLVVKDPPVIVPETAIQRLIEKYRELLDAEIHVGDEDQELAKAKALLADPKYAAATERERQTVLAYADGLDKLRAKFSEMSNAQTQFRQSEIRDTERTNEALRQANLSVVEAFNQLSAATPSKQIEEFNKLLDVLQDKLNKGAISAQLYSEIFNGAFAKLPETLKPVLTSLDEFLKSAAENIQRSLGDTIYRAFKGNTDNMLEAWIDMLQRMAAEAIAANISRKLFGDTSTSGSGGTPGIFSDILSQIGKWFTGGGKASGGSVSAFSLQPVNERGPELLQVGGQSMLMMGAQGGRVVPNNMLGGSTLNVSFNIASGVSRNELAAMVPQLTAHIKAEVMQTMRRPGYQRA